jgi:hypothetical protein
MQSLLSGLSFVAGLVVSRPEDFVWLMLASCAVITMAAMLYTSYAWPRARLCAPSGDDENINLLST